MRGMHEGNVQLIISGGIFTLFVSKMDTFSLLQNSLINKVSMILCYYMKNGTIQAPTKGENKFACGKLYVCTLVLSM